MPTSAQLSSPDSAMSPCPESSAPAEQHLAIPPTSPKFPLQALYCPSSSARNASASSFRPLYFTSQNSTHAPGLSLPPSPAHPSPLGVHTEPVCLPPSAHPPCFHEKDEETRRRHAEGRTSPESPAYSTMYWLSHLGKITLSLRASVLYL